MVARITTNRVFSGRVYGKARPTSCSAEVANSLDFDLSMGFGGGDAEDCGVASDGAGGYAADLVVQHHPAIVTAADVGLRVRCRYALANRTVEAAAEVGGGPGEGGSGGGGAGLGASGAGVAPAPNVTLRVTDRAGRDVSAAKVGDPLALTFEVLPGGGGFHSFGIFVRDLVAMDGSDSSEILLVDDRGCPTDYSILAELSAAGGDNDTSSDSVLRASFDAFKFPTSDVVQFRALVTPCIPRCDPVSCRVEDYYGRGKTLTSFGRRRRRRSLAAAEEDDLVVAGAVKISDKFPADGGKEEDNK